MNLIHQKTWPPGGVASFPYVPLENLNFSWNQWLELKTFLQNGHKATHYKKRGQGAWLIETKENFKIHFLKSLNIRIQNTVKPVLSGHLKIDQTKVLMENNSLMEVKSIVEAFCNIFDLH